MWSPTDLYLEQIGTVVATSSIPSQEVAVPFGRWAPDRLIADLQETHSITMRRSRMGELLHAEGLRWGTQETWFGEQVDPAFAEERGSSSYRMDVVIDHQGAADPSPRWPNEAETTRRSPRPVSPPNRHQCREH